jgi:hypothetical protein
MPKLCSRFVSLVLPFALLITFANRTWGAELRVQIRSPNNGAQITQEQDYLLVSGKVASGANTSPLVDIILLLDVSGSTAKYAGVDFPEVAELADFYLYPGKRSYYGSAVSGPLNKRNSIFAAEILASRRLLSQLNPETTRVGLITFGDGTWLRQPLTHDFDEVRGTLDAIYSGTPRGGTNMAAGILLGVREMLGRGQSEKYLESIKALLLLTDGLPTLPYGGGTRPNEADIDLTIDAARQAGAVAIAVDAFGLGERATSYPRALVGIAQESGGTYMPVSRPADILAVLDKVSAVGVDSIQVTNETIQRKALQSRLAFDGFFASAVPVVEGLNRIQVLGRASDGSLGQDTITVRYEPGDKRSLDLEIFLQNEKRNLELDVSLEREKNLKLEVERLGKSAEQIRRDGPRNPEASLKQPATSSPPSGELFNNSGPIMAK